MAISVKDRQRKWRERQEQTGKKAITVTISREAFGALHILKEQTGRGYSDIIERLVTSNRSLSSPLNMLKLVAEKANIPPHPGDGPLYANKREDGRKRLSQIMEIALRLFAQNGYHATPIEDIIHEARIARRTFYLHFKNKEELLESIINRYLSMLYDRFDQVMSETRGSKSEGEILQAMLKAINETIRIPEYRLFGRLLLGEIVGLKGKFWKQIETFFGDMISLGIATVESLKTAGTIPIRIDPLITTLCVIGAWKEIIFHALVREQKMDAEHAVLSAIDLFSYGVFQ